VRSRVGAVPVGFGGAGWVWADVACPVQQNARTAESIHREVRDLNRAVAGINTFDRLRKTD
jgi:hypothetical protein